MKLGKMPTVMATLVVLALLQSASIIGQTLLLSSTISNLFGGYALASQVLGIVGFFACFALLHVLRFAQDAFLERFARSQAHELHRRLLARVFDAKTLLARKAGSFIVANAATEGIDQVQLYIRVIPPKIVGMLAISLPVLVAAFILDWISGVILAVMFPVTVFFMITLGKQASSRAERQYASYTRLTGRFMDTLRGLGVIKAFGASEAEGASVFEFSERLRTTTIGTLATATLSSAVLDLCATFGVAAVAMMLAFRLMDGSLGLATALAALILAPEYFLPIRAFASDFHASLNGKNSLSSILEMIEGQDRDDQSTAYPPIGIWNEQSSLVLDDVSFNYEGESSGISSISLSATGFRKIAIVGKSGAGKSTLANLLAGFIEPETGRVRINGEQVDLSSSEWKRQVRYIPQNPYIFNASLRANIAFYAPNASEGQISAAIETVGLEELVEELPEGLDTVIGEGGHGLSGGQAHRIALARVLLDDSARVLVFDEPTAHLDIETELELKRRMLPIMEGKLVFFATHRLHWIHDMDCVIELDGGRIVKVSEPAPGNSNFPAHIEADSLGDEHRRERRERSLQIEDSASERGSSQRPAWLKSHIVRYKRWVIIAILLGLISAGCSALLMFTSGYLISATAQTGTTLFSIMVPVALVQVFGLGRPLAHYVERLISHDWVLKITSDLRRALYWGVERRLGNPAHERATGEYLSLLSDDVDHLQNLYLRVGFPIAIAALLALGAAVLFFCFSPVFGAIMLIALVVIAVLVPQLCRRLTCSYAHEAKARRLLEYKRITDNVLGATDWVLSNRARAVEESHAQSDEALRKLDSTIRIREQAVTLVDALLLGGLACLIITWSGAQFGSDPHSANYIAAFALGFFPLAQTLETMPSSSAQAASHEDAITRLDEYVSVGEAAVPDRKTETSPSSTRCEAPDQAIELDSIEYSYPGSYTKALDKVSLSVRTGESIAILGRSGSGKSTLANVVRGVLKPSHGTVSVADASQTLSIGYMGQTPYLFNRSLRDNLTLGVLEAPDDELIEILKSVGLENKLATLEKGLDTIVGETGTGFSGGEAHRIALARVLVADAPIVIVDEPFSALDPATETNLLDTLLDVCRNRTLIVITHHLAEIMRFDRVLFVEKGAISLDGAPDELAEQSVFFRTLLEFDR